MPCGSTVWWRICFQSPESRTKKAWPPWSRQTNPWKKDTDRDGLGDKIEITKYRTNPCNWDTDRDGLSDGREVKGPIKAFPACHTNPLNRDTDHGGWSDGVEVKRDENKG